MQTREGTTVGHLAKRQQTVRGQGSGTGGRALMEMGVQSAIVVYGRAQQKRAMRVRGQRTERLLWACCWFTRIREVTIAVGS